MQKTIVGKTLRFDSVPIKAEYTEEGYLVDTPILTSVGIFEYTNADGSIRRELKLDVQLYDGSVVKAMVYIMNYGKGSVPNRYYYNTIREGYEDVGFWKMYKFRIVPYKNIAKTQENCLQIVCKSSDK